MTNSRAFQGFFIGAIVGFGINVIIFTFIGAMQLAGHNVSLQDWLSLFYKLPDFMDVIEYKVLAFIVQIVCGVIGSIIFTRG